MRALGCDAYAGAGQKWLCGPDGTGMLYVSPRAARAPGGLATRLRQPRTTPTPGLDARVHEDARRFDTLSLNAETHRLRAGLLRRARVRRLGRPCTSTRARSPRGWPSCSPSAGASPRLVAHTTLVSFPSPDPDAERASLAERGVIVRNIPGRPWLRASVGAWNDEHDLERLLEGLSA